MDQDELNRLIKQRKALKSLLDEANQEANQKLKQPAFGEDVDKLKPILGIREWNIGGKKLFALNPRGSFWVPGLNKATCWSGGTKAPCSTLKGTSLECHCGFNAWFDRNTSALGISLGSKTQIVGAIAAAGDIQVHESGFRAAEAQILGLVYPSYISKNRNYRYSNRIENWWKNVLINKKRKQIEKIAKHYQVPLFETYEELFDFAKDYATPIDKWSVNIKPTDKAGVSLGRKSTYFKDIIG